MPVTAAKVDGARLGVDVGGTRLKLGLLHQGAVVARIIVPADMNTPAALVAAIRTAALRLSDDCGLPITAAGVGIAGVLGLGGSPVLQSPNLPWLDGVDLRAALSASLDVPVHCDNDANCVGWGEAMAGAGRGASDQRSVNLGGVNLGAANEMCPNQICLALGTGVGGSLVVDGELEHGSRGRGAELGHICVDRRGAPCGCGGRGCLEQYASQTGLLRMMAEVGLPADGPDAIPALFAAAAAEDPRARAVVDHAGAALGQAIAGLIRLTGVRCYVFAGGISAALPQLRPSMCRALDRYAVSDGVALLLGTLGPDAGVIGAALLDPGPHRDRC